MEVFLTNGYTGSSLKTLNECRMWLRTITTANITTADGYRLTLDAWNGKHNHSRCHHYQWPWLQWRLSTRHWTLWKQPLEKCFTINATHLYQWLHLPLGNWTLPVINSWQCHYHSQTHRLCTQEDQQWREYCACQTGRRTRSRCYTLGELLPMPPPPGLLLASCQKLYDKIQLLCHCCPAINSIPAAIAQHLCSIRWSKGYTKYSILGRKRRPHTGSSPFSRLGCYWCCNETSSTIATAMGEQTR